MPFKNREYQLAYRKKWYAKNKESEIAHVTRRKNEIRAWLQTYKLNLKCIQCGETHPATLEFHHLQGVEKDRNIACMVNDGVSIKKILLEIEKCVVLCANCHRKIHHPNG
jgi:hypothetical protein